MTLPTSGPGQDQLLSKEGQPDKTKKTVSTSIPREEEKSETQAHFIFHVDDSYSKGKSLSLSIGAEMEFYGRGFLEA